MNNDESETFRRLKREPDFEKVQAAINESGRKALEELGWTMSEWSEEYSRRQSLERDRWLQSLEDHAKKKLYAEFDQLSAEVTAKDIK